MGGTNKWEVHSDEAAGARLVPDFDLALVSLCVALGVGCIEHKYHSSSLCPGNSLRRISLKTSFHFIVSWNQDLLIGSLLTVTHTASEDICTKCPL